MPPRESATRAFSNLISHTPRQQRFSSSADGAPWPFSEEDRGNATPNLVDRREGVTRNSPETLSIGCCQSLTVPSLPPCSKVGGSPRLAIPVDEWRRPGKARDTRQVCGRKGDLRLMLGQGSVTNEIRMIRIGKRQIEYKISWWEQV